MPIDYDAIKPNTSLYTDAPSRLFAMSLVISGGDAGGVIQVSPKLGISGWITSTTSNRERIRYLAIGTEYRIAPEPQAIAPQPMPEASPVQAECMFAVGEHYKTRDGKDAKVLAVCMEPENYQIVSIIANVSEIHTITGRYFDIGEESGMDLMPRTKTVWVAQCHPACDSEAASQERYPSAIGHHAIQVNA